MEVVHNVDEKSCQFFCQLSTGCPQRESVPIILCIALYCDEWDRARKLEKLLWRREEANDITPAHILGSRTCEPNCPQNKNDSESSYIIIYHVTKTRKHSSLTLVSCAVRRFNIHVQ